MIKAEFKNIGPILDAELELGDLTIIAGQNNTGKTYLVYTLDSFLRFLKTGGFHTQYSLTFSRDRDGTPKILKDLATEIDTNGKASIGISEYRKFMNEQLRQAAEIFSIGPIAHAFSASMDEFEGTELKMKIEDTSSEVEDPLRYIVKAGDVFLDSEIKGNDLIFKVDAPDDLEIPYTHIVKGLYLSMFMRKNAKYPRPFILSAERFGISLFYKELDPTKGQPGKTSHPYLSMEEMGEKSLRYTQPVRCNVNFTLDLPNVQKEKSGFPADKMRSVEMMMGGYYKVENNEIWFISKKRGGKEFNIPLHLASSSARGLSDLYFYLKHAAKPGDILMIDEPESHLSSTNQISIARLLAFCVNAGLKVLITTHSDYLIKEVNNLIVLSGDFSGKAKFLKTHKKDYTENDYLKPHSVKAYICEEGALKPCEIDEYGINMPVFDDAINKVNQISNTLHFLRADHEGLLDD